MRRRIVRVLLAVLAAGLSKSALGDDTTRPEARRIQEWQIRGIVAAFDDTDETVRALAAKELASLKVTTGADVASINRFKDLLPRIGALLGSSNKDVLDSALACLEAFGAGARSEVPSLLRLLSKDRSVRVKLSRFGVESSEIACVHNPESV